MYIHIYICRNVYVCSMNTHNYTQLLMCNHCVCVFSKKHMEKANCINICRPGSICSRWLCFASRRASLSVLHGRSSFLPGQDGRSCPFTSIHSHRTRHILGVLETWRNAWKARSRETMGSGVHTVDQLLVSCVALGRWHAMSIPVSLSVRWA